ncbi:MAG: prepilin-type N-terminal cleavage/methylation domain-containing protein [Sulfurimonas sp.]
MRNAFTMIEMVFVIVVLGILASLAMPKLAATRDDAVITKGRADIASIRSAIVTERQSRLIKGCSTFIANGTSTDDTTTCTGLTMKQLDAGGLFGGVLMYPITASTGNDGWSATAGSGTYVYKVSGSSNTFAYTPADGKFLCTEGTECALLAN